MQVNEYCGETLAKKVARVRLYRRTKAALQYSFNRDEQFSALILPGPNAAEVGALKHILNVSNLVAVDADESSIHKIKECWPNVKTFHGDLRDSALLKRVKRAIGEVHFLHLDLMGSVSKHTELLYGSWGNLTKVGGVAAITFFRGREKKELLKAMEYEFAERLLKAIENGVGEAKLLRKLLGSDPIRVLIHQMALNRGIHTFRHANLDAFCVEHLDDDLEIKEVLAKADKFIDEVVGGVFTVLGSYTYQSSSPMGVVATHFVKSAELNSNTYAQLLRHRISRDTCCEIDRDPMTELLMEADSLAKTFDNREIAEILNVSSGTLAAWRAHRTMGTYKS